MTSRLLAFMLACLIGVPMCWCCEAGAQGGVPQEEVLCCHAAADVDTGAGHSAPYSASDADKDKDCPCEGILKTRDKVAHEVVAPVSGWVPVAVDMASEAVLELPKPVGASAASVFDDFGPHEMGRPLYQRHCRWLI